MVLGRLTFLVVAVWLLSPHSILPQETPAGAVAGTSAPEAPQQLPPFPELEWDRFPDDVRKQIESVYRPARRNPEDAQAVGLLGMMLDAHLLHEQAEPCYVRAHMLAPEDFRWTYYLGIVRESLGKRESALSLIREAIAMAPRYAPAQVRLADLLLEEGKLDESEAQYRAAIAVKPGLASAHLGLGRVLVAKGEFETAVAEFERAVEIESDYAPAYYALGMAYRKVKNVKGARDALRRFQQVKDVEEPSFDPEYEAVSGLIGEVPPASPSLDIPDSGLEQTAAELERALKEEPQMVSAHSTLIAIYWELGKPELAEQHYQAGLAINPEYPELHYNWAVTQLVRGNPQAAEASFKRAIELDPEYDDAFVQYGLLLEKLQRREEALDLYRQALAINPDHRRAHYRMGIAMFMQGNHDEGLRHFEETTKIRDRETPRFLLLLARTHAHLGNMDEARDYLERSRNLAVALEMDEFVAQLDQEQRQLASGGQER